MPLLDAIRGVALGGILLANLMSFLRALLLSSIGMVIGIAGSVLVGRLLAHGVRGMSGPDSLSFAASVGVLFLVTASACTVPAWRASRTDPALTLRQE
jgi:putative ABC transport system permease protein